MNILLAPTVYLPFASGVPIFVRQLADGYVGRGHNVVVVAPRLGPDEPEVEIVNAVEIHRRPFLFPARIVWQQGDERLLPFCRRAPGDLRHLMRLVQAREIELINIHSLTGSVFPYALAASRLAARPLVLTLHGREFDQLEHSARIRRVLLRRSFRRADRIVAISAQLASEACRFSPSAASKVTVVPNGIAPGQFGAAGPGGAGGDVPGRYLLTVGRLNRLKGHDVLLAAFRSVAEQDSHIQLVIAGDGPERIRLHAVSLALGLRHRVTFLGQIAPEQVRPLLAGCELLVLPSWSEGLPTVVLEAMASGKAVVATRVGGVPEVIREPETGLLVPPGDPATLASAILTLLQDAERRTAMGNCGRAFVRAQHDIATATDRYLAIYDAAIRESPAIRRRRHRARRAAQLRPEP